MPLDITHSKVSSVPDDPSHPEEVQPSDWNDSHTVSGELEDTSVVLNGSIGTYADGASLHDVLTGIVTSPGGGGGGWEVDGSTGTKLETGRTYVRSAGSGDSYVYLSDSGVDIVSGGMLYLNSFGDVMFLDHDGEGVVLGGQSSPPSVGVYDDGQLYVDDRDTFAFLRMGQPDISSSPEVWLHQGFPSSGWCPQAFPLGFVNNGVYTTARDLAANHGTLAVPFWLPAPMNLAAVQFWNTDTASARSWEVALWHQPFNDSSTNDKLLEKVPGSQNFGSATPASAGLRGVSYSTFGCYVPAGLIWVTIKNTHASNTLGIGYAAGSTQMPVNLAQSKTLSSTAFDDDTLDFVAATWTKLTDIHAVVLRGRVFGQSGSF